MSTRGEVWWAHRERLLEDPEAALASLAPEDDHELPAALAVGAWAIVSEGCAAGDPFVSKRCGTMVSMFAPGGSLGKPV